MARRKLDEKRYDDRIYLRCLSDQKDTIKANADRAGFQSTSQYILEVALKGKVVIQKNTLSFFEYALIHEMREAGRRLDKHLHRANIHQYLHNGIEASLVEVKHLLNYISYTMRLYGTYEKFLSDPEQEKTDEWRGKKPPVLHPKLVFQINKLWSNLNQLHRIADGSEVYPHDLAVCKQRAEYLLENLMT